MKKTWIIGSILGLAVAGLAASDAHALRPYTPQTSQCRDTHKDCCVATSSTQVGAFDLTDVSADKDAARTCPLDAKGCSHAHAKNACCDVTLGDIIVKPWQALFNDAHLLVTIPFRKAEPLN